MSFEEAVLACERLRPHFRKGLEALGKDRVRVTIQDTRKLSGSVNIEAAQHKEDGEARTWDYGIRSEFQ